MNRTIFQRNGDFLIPRTTLFSYRVTLSFSHTQPHAIIALKHIPFLFSITLAPPLHDNSLCVPWLTFFLYFIGLQLSQQAIHSETDYDSYSTMLFVYLLVGT
jgi:hypothetical protein